ncbi:MAG: heme exporter protein CcmD [Pseudomonadota bacterium]
MGGYAFYVWGSLVVVLASIAGELAELAWRKKTIQTELCLLQITRRKTVSKRI